MGRVGGRGLRVEGLSRSLKPILLRSWAGHLHLRWQGHEVCRAAGRVPSTLRILRSLYSAMLQCTGPTRAGRQFFFAARESLSNASAAMQTLLEWTSSA